MVKDPASRRLLSKLLRDVGVDDVTDVEGLDHAMLQLRHGTKAFQLVCCDTLGGNGHLELLKFVRWQTTLPLPRSLPVLCISDQWAGEQLVAARDAGASAMLSWPLPRHALQMALTSVTSAGKRFIESPTFRGFCRRVARVSGYKGPFLRAEDTKFGHVAHSPRIANAVAEMQGKAERAQPAPAPAPPLADARRSVPSIGTTLLERSILESEVETGIPDVDLDHKRIRESLVRVGQAESTEAARSRLATLRKFVQQHFQREEMIMSSFGYAELARHKATHNQFMAQIVGLSTDLDQTGRPPGMDTLVTLAQWLNRHIAEDDVGYVHAMLRGDLKALENPASRQATIVLHGAFELTAIIDDLRIQLSTAGGQHNPAARWIRHKLFDATEKLANLLMLVPEGSQEWHQLSHNLQSGFQRVRASFYAAAADMAAVRIDKIISEAEVVLKDHGAVPFGISAKLSLRWAGIEALSTILGGGRTMDDELRLKFFRAKELIHRVTELEGERCQLIDFTGNDQVAFAPAGIHAEYQTEVIELLTKKPPTEIESDR